MRELRRKLQNQQRRTIRTRATLHGTAQRPRLSVTISNRHVSAQIIDDDAHTTLVSATSVTDKSATGTLTDRAAVVGAAIATQAKAKKINQVVFDRGSRLYHGRVKALADAAREKGLEF